MTPIEAWRFCGELAPYRANLVWDDAEGQPDAAGMLEQLRRFQHSLRGSWQPACSLWAQVYFNTLLIPGLCLLAGDVGHGARATAIVGSFCPTSGAPLRFALRRAGSGDSEAHAESGLFDLLDRHVDGVIDAINTASHLSKRLLRESAARTVTWTVCEIARHDAAAAGMLTALFAARSDACALCLSDRDGADRMRRTCCLRDRLPGYDSCGAICPSGCAARQAASQRRAPAKITA